MTHEEIRERLLQANDSITSVDFEPVAYTTVKIRMKPDSKYEDWSSVYLAEMSILDECFGKELFDFVVVHGG